MIKKSTYIVLLLSIVFFVSELNAKIVLNPVFSDNMVLQQQSVVPVWGKGNPGKTLKITTSWDNKTTQTIIDKTGNWKTSIQTPVCGGPYKIEITDGTKTVLNNVMIGEVWLCSGQSNMEMPLAGWGKIMNFEQEIASADYPEIRLLTVEKKIAFQPQKDISVKNNNWQVCSPKTIPEFSAVAYFFARNLYQKLHIPIGLINSTWGGTVAEAWTSSGSLKSMPDFKNGLKQIEQINSNRDSVYKSYLADSLHWQNEIIRIDKGFNQGIPIWNNENFDDSSWKTMNIPDYWETKELPGFDGVVWFRKTIELPDSWKNKQLSLHLDLVDDNDITYFNGTAIGHTENYTLSRNYVVPSKLVKSGKNVITVRVTDMVGGGGINGNPDGMKLSLSDSEFIPLAGTWKYNVGMNLLQAPPAPDRWVNPNRTSLLYNAMISRLIPFNIKGVIWYQGEANTDRADQYRELFPLLIQDWRKQWNYDFPFYFVQLANYMPQISHPTESAWAKLREAQLNTLHLDKTGMAVIIDIGDAKDIHPKNKQEVGRRLALVALVKTYKQNVTSSGPVYDSYKIIGNTIIIKFKHANHGLEAKNNDQLKGFAIAGADHKFYWANATIKENEVVVSCNEVEFPMAVRYGWADNPDCNLYNTEGLPATPFRTDEW